MEWLGQNWIYLLLAGGVIFLMRRGGLGCGPGSGHRHGGGREDDASRPQTQAAVDPVSGQPVDPKTAIATVYQGTAYYFATRENRDRFEAAPEQFARKGGGHEGHEEHGRHRHGC